MATFVYIAACSPRLCTTRITTASHSFSAPNYLSSLSQFVAQKRTTKPGKPAEEDEEDEEETAAEKAAAEKAEREGTDKPKKKKEAEHQEL